MKSWVLNLNFAFLTLIFNLFIFFSSVHAWQAPVEVAIMSEKGEKIYNKLVAGIESNATERFDNLWDTPALISHPDPENPVMLRAYFTTPTSPGGVEEKYSDDARQKLWKDIRGPSIRKITWDITVDSVPAGKEVVISWNMQKGMLKPGEHLLLIDNDRMGNDGKPIEIDTIQSPGYQFVSYGEEPRSFALILQKGPPKNSSSGSGFFGCGTIRSHRSKTHGGGASALGILVIFTPLVLRLLRLKIFRVTTHGTVR